MATAYERILASRKKFEEQAGLTEQQYEAARQYALQHSNGQALYDEVERTRQMISQPSADITTQHKNLNAYTQALRKLDTFMGQGGQVAGVNTGYLQSLQEQYNQSWDVLKKQIQNNQMAYQIPGLAQQAEQLSRERGMEITPARLMGQMGLVDANGNLTEAGQKYWQRGIYRNIQTESGQEAARWGQQNQADMDELETVQYWQDIVRNLPQTSDSRVMASNQEWLRQAAEATGITSYTDAADLSAQLAARESQLRAKSGWSERMANRNAGRQQMARAYEYQLDNPDESIEANYYLALRDEAGRDARTVDGFMDFMQTPQEAKNWLRYNSAYANQLYQDQKNEDILAIRSDPTVGAIYQETMEASRATGEVATLRAQAHGEMQDYGGISAQTEAAIRELAQQYGITVGQGDDALEAALEQIHQQQSHTVNTNMARLQAQGYDPEKLRQYIQQALNEERMDAQNAEARQYASEHPGAASVGTGFTNLMSGGAYIATAPQAFGNMVAGLTGNYDSYVPIDPNNPAFDQAQYVMAVRDEVSQNLAEKYPNGEFMGQNTASFLYGTGMSMLDNMVQMAVGAAIFGPAAAAGTGGARAAIQAGVQAATPATLATMGLSAAAQQLTTLTEHGVPSDQAYLLATLNGGVEIITEKIGIDALVSSLGRKEAAQILRVIFQQMAAEGAEEGLAEIGNLAADYIVRMDDSEIMQMIDAGRRQGMTEEQAKQAASKTFAQQLVSAVAAGAISGFGFGAMSSAGIAADAVSPASAGARIRAEGNEEALGTLATAFGVEYSPDMSDRQIGKTYRAVQKAGAQMQRDMQYGMSMASYAKEKGYDSSTTKALERSWDAYHSVYGNDMSSREFAATWNSVKTAGQVNMAFDTAVAELGETKLSMRTLENAYKAGQRLYNLEQKAAKKQTKAAHAVIEQANETAVELVSENVESMPAQTELVERDSESAAQHAQQLMSERINVNALSDEAVEAFFSESDSDISTERQGALAMARMLTGVSKNISQVVFVDSANYDAEGHVRTLNNGMWDPTNRTMTIDINAGRLNVEQQMTFMTRAMSHELTHSIKTSAPSQYAELERFVLREMDKQRNLENLIRAKVADYAKEGIELDRQGAIDELVAEACEQMLERTDVLNKLAQENKSLWEKIRDYIKSVIAKLKALYKNLSPNSTEAKMMQGVINDLQAKWDAAFKASLTAENEKNSGQTQHMVAGRWAAYADSGQLARAEEMENKGANALKILKETGWYRGADGQWRFEIDDSVMRYKRPLPSLLKRTNGQVLLKDILYHPDLFANYPFLNKVKVIFMQMPEGQRGSYNPYTATVKLNVSLLHGPEATLLHELQHAIQEFEGFAGGAYQGYWRKKKLTGYIETMKVRELENKIMEFSMDPKTRDAAAMWHRMQEVKEDPNALKELKKEAARDGLTMKIAKFQSLQDQRAKAAAEFVDRDSYDLYRNTAGEVEARTTAERQYMTESERRNNLHFVGDKNTVFADVFGEPMEKANEMLENYKGGHRKFPVAQKIVDEFVADYKNAHPRAQYQISRDTASTMDLLMGASMDGLSKAEADHLLRYRDRVNEIRKNQRKIDELKAEELTADINAQIHRLESQNSMIYRKVASAEKSDMMQRIAERERAAGDIEVQRMDNRVADLEDEIDELEQKIRNAKLAGQMGQGRRDAANLRKTEERLTKRNEKQKQTATDKAAKQKQQAAERLDAQKQKYTDKLKEQRTQAKQAAADARLAGQMEQGRRDAANLQRTVEEYEARLESKRRELRIARESRDKRIAQMQESRVKSVDSRHRTQMRHKIRKVVKELDSLLLRGTKDRNVRDEMKAAVASALEAINMDTGDYEGRIAKLDEAIATATDPVVVETLTESRNRIAEQGSNMESRLEAMKTAYSKFSKDTSGNYNSTYDEVVQSYIDATIEKVGKTPLWDMSMGQLEAVYNMYKMILTDIQQANKLVRDEKNRTIYSMGNHVIRELDHNKRKTTQPSIVGTGKQFFWNILKPATAIDVIGSNTLRELYWAVQGGEAVFATDVREGTEFFEKTAEKYKINKWDMKKTYDFASRSGKKFSLNLEQIMSLYAYSKREQADLHLKNGGFVFDSSIKVTKKVAGLPVEYDVVTEDAHGIDPNTYADIIATMDEVAPDARKFVDEMQAYLSDVMGAKGNEVSLDMYGVRLFNEKNYFPLKTANQFKFQENNPAGEVKVKNSGFSKHTIPNAGNPVILSNFTDVWGKHINDMAMYHAFVIPLENFNRVYNYQTLSTDEAEPASVKGTIGSIFGKAAKEYIHQLLVDLNGGARSDPTAGVFDKMLSRFKAGAVSMSLSVAIQQPTSIVRAASFIDEKYLLLGDIKRKATEKGTKHSDLWEEMKKYAPAAVIKEMGRFDTNMGKETAEWVTKDKRTGFDKFKDNAQDVISWLPAKLDEVTWTRIWQAVKAETADKTDLKPGTEAFFRHCGERCNEILVYSQVYDSVLTKSPVMRSKNTFMKMSTAFMAEPLTTANMMVRGIMQFKRGYRRAGAKTIASVASSLVVNRLLVSIIYAMRDDDEDENFLEKYFQALGSGTLDTFADLLFINTLPFTRDIYSIVLGYDIERTDMSVISDLVKSIKNISNENLSPEEKALGVADNFFALLGIPVKNVRRDIMGIINTVKSLISDHSFSLLDVTEGFAEGFTHKTRSNGYKIFKAYTTENEDMIARIENDYKQKYGQDWYSEMRSDLSEYVREQYQKGTISEEVATNMLVTYIVDLSDSIEQQHDTGTITDEEYLKMLQDEAYWTIKGWDAKAEDSDASTGKYADLNAAIIAGGDITAATEELLEHGVTQEDIDGAASSQIRELYRNGDIDAETAEEYLAEYANLTDSKKLYTWFTESDHWIETGESDYGAYGPVWDAILNGGDVNGAIDAMVEAGWTEDAVAQNIRSKTKEWVLGTSSDGYTVSTTEARDIISKYGGVEDEDLDEYVAVYNFWLDNPDYADDFDHNTAFAYTQYGTGIDLDVYLEYREDKAGIQGEGKKDRIMAIIDAMPITNEQKDQLYYENNWAESRIYEAPWH